LPLSVSFRLLPNFSEFFRLFPFPRDTSGFFSFLQFSSVSARFLVEYGLILNSLHACFAFSAAKVQRLFGIRRKKNWSFLNDQK